jgi:hypothetical protein
MAYFFREKNDPFDILLRLGGEPDDEIETQVVNAVAREKVNRPEDITVTETFRNRGAETLAPGFRCKSYGPVTAEGQKPGQAIGDGVCPDGCKGDFAATSHDVLTEFGQTGMVS